MRKTSCISLIGIVCALAGSAVSAPAQAAPHARHHNAASAARARRHARILANRRTRVYYLRRTYAGMPARRDRIYFATIADARAAGYQPARRDTVPIDPRLTWRNGRSLPSLGTRREPTTPRGIQKPAAPPNAQQPHVTPTQPMPN